MAIMLPVRTKKLNSVERRPHQQPQTCQQLTLTNAET